MGRIKTVATRENTVINITTMPNCWINGMFETKTELSPAVVVAAASTSDNPVFSIAFLVASVFDRPAAISSRTRWVRWIA